MSLFPLVLDTNDFNCKGKKRASNFYGLFWPTYLFFYDFLLPVFKKCVGFVTGDGSGVHIYVIDTGTSSTHNEFAGRFSDQGFDLFNEEIGKVTYPPHTHTQE